jgi:hypothetical protein
MENEAELILPYLEKSIVILIDSLAHLTKYSIKDKLKNSIAELIRKLAA